MLEVVRAGPLVTVQDAGRIGLRAFGVSAAGPMEPDAMVLANALAGNTPEMAVLEFASVGGTFRATKDMYVAVTGSDAALWIDDSPARPCQTLSLSQGQTLRVGSLGSTLWGYIAVLGGIACDPVMGSRSTQLRFALGGHLGRTLEAGDTLPVGPCTAPPSLRKATSRPASSALAEIRVLLGPQDDFFSQEVLTRFLSAYYSVSPKFDRMAMTLEGPSLEAEKGHDIVSDGTLPGSIQVPGSGVPLVLMAEGQTTGGYPKIATVIGADLPRLAQLRPGTRLSFKAVTLDEAENALVTSRKATRAMLSSLGSADPIQPTSERLLSVNLISGVWPEDEASPNG